MCKQNSVCALKRNADEDVIYTLKILAINDLYNLLLGSNQTHCLVFIQIIVHINISPKCVGI